MEQRTVLGVCHGCDNERYQQMLTELREIAAAANLRSGRLECLMFIQTLRRIIPEEIKLFSGQESDCLRGFGGIQEVARSIRQLRQ